jgi:hypothetical protein
VDFNLVPGLYRNEEKGFLHIDWDVP